MSPRADGIDQSLGDRCSSIAYGWAKSTFSVRGEDAATYDDSFANVLRVHGTALAITSDGVGTKVELAERMKTYDTLGYDLLAMVADDLAAIGAEPVAISNILDVDRLDETIVDRLLCGLARAAIECSVVISGGEIAQLGERIAGYGDAMHFNWAATAIGVLPKAIAAGSGGSWRGRLAQGDAVVALASAGFRSNGFTLARRILETAHGPEWHSVRCPSGRPWGDALLVPSRLYAPAIVSLIRSGCPLCGAVHVTGGGVPGNLARLLRGTGLGATLDSLWPPHAGMLELIRMGTVDLGRAFDQWNMGNGMLLVLPETEVSRAIDHLEQCGQSARFAGRLDDSGRISIDGTAWGGERIDVSVGRAP